MLCLPSFPVTDSRQQALVSALTAAVPSGIFTRLSILFTGKPVKHLKRMEFSVLYCSTFAQFVKGSSRKGRKLFCFPPFQVSYDPKKPEKAECAPQTAQIQAQDRHFPAALTVCSVRIIPVKLSYHLDPIWLTDIAILSTPSRIRYRPIMCPKVSKVTTG